MLIPHITVQYRALAAESLGRHEHLIAEHLLKRGLYNLGDSAGDAAAEVRGLNGAMSALGDALREVVSDDGAGLDDE